MSNIFVQCPFNRYILWYSQITMSSIVSVYLVQQRIISIFLKITYDFSLFLLLLLLSQISSCFHYILITTEIVSSVFKLSTFCFKVFERHTSSLICVRLMRRLVWLCKFPDLRQQQYHCTQSTDVSKMLRALFSTVFSRDNTG